MTLYNCVSCIEPVTILSDKNSNVIHVSSLIDVTMNVKEVEYYYYTACIAETIIILYGV